MFELDPYKRRQIEYAINSNAWETLEGGVTKMSDFTATALSTLLGVLQKLPIRILSGLMLAGIAVLFVPPIAGVDLTEFRKHWAVWIWIGTLTAGGLTIAWLVEAGVRQYFAHRKFQAARRVLTFIPRLHESIWNLVKQQDDTFTSQFRLSFDVGNPTQRPLRLVKIRLLRPKMKGEVVNAEILLPEVGSPFHSNMHAVPPNRSVTATAHIIVRGAAAAAGRRVHATIGVTDQYGVEYRVKGFLLKDLSAKAPYKNLWQRFISKLSKVRQVLWHTPVEVEPLPALWGHQGKFEKADLILDEEKRCYTANN
jgi:hypothetical protein